MIPEGTFSCILMIHTYSGYVTHGTDRVLWALRFPSLEQDQVEIAKGWLNKVAEEVNKIRINGGSTRLADVRNMLTLKEDRSIAWTKDEKWDALIKLEKVLESTWSNELKGSF